MRASPFGLATLALLVAVAACEDDTTGPVDTTPANFELEAVHHITQEDDGTSVVTEFLLVAGDEETAARVDEVHSVEIYWPDQGRTFDASPEFVQEDGRFISRYVEEGIPGPAPDGTYDVRISFNDVPAQYMELDLATTVLGAIEIVDLTADGDEATLTWMAPDEEHEWRIELLGLVEDAFEVVLDVDGDVVTGGGEVESTFSLDEIGAGEEFRVRLIASNDENERTVTVTTPANFELEAFNHITQEGDESSVVTEFILTAADDASAARVGMINSVEIVWPEGEESLDASPEFVDEDGSFVFRYVEEGIPGPAPEGTYEVRLTYDDLGARHLEFELEATVLGAIEIDELHVHEDEVTLEWTAPDEEHEWRIELLGLVEGSADEFEVVLDVEGDVASDGEEVESTFSLEEIGAGEEFQIRLIAWNAENQRTVILSGTKPE